MPRFTRTFLSLFVVLCLATPALAGHDTTKAPKRAIVVAAFGTPIPEAAPAITKMVDRVQAAYPGVPVSLCYTAAMIRAKLAKQGQHVPSPPRPWPPCPTRRHRRGHPVAPDHPRP
jgi:sirohydrochlorin cobaltochelatase